MRQCVSLLLLLLVGWSATPARAVEIAPFAVRNQSPLVQIFGLPAGSGARLPAPGSGEAVLAVDIASHFTDDVAAGERILLDGESYRFSLLLRRSVGEKLTIGLELPYLWHRDGFLDAFIEGWHDTFHLPQGGRDEAPRERLLFTYSEDGRERLRLDGAADGPGDIRLTGAWRLQEDESSALALHAALELPTGDSDRLLGSGSTDLALWLAADRSVGAEVTLYGGAGALFLSDGDVLRGRQRNLAGFAQLGAGWRPWAPVLLKMQVDGHTALFASDLRPLGGSLQLTLGGTLDWGTTSLDIGVSEDILVDTAADVVFHLALRHRR